MSEAVKSTLKLDVGEADELLLVLAALSTVPVDVSAPHAAGTTVNPITKSVRAMTSWRDANAMCQMILQTKNGCPSRLIGK